MKFFTSIALCLVVFAIVLPSRYECKIVQFIFGDSLSDVGNNARLSKSLAQANLPWYGIDFGNGLPNGRFTNGRTVSDIIGDKMGLPRPPAFMDPSVKDDVILKNGVNYASGGGGILNETGGLFIQKFSLSKQVELFEGTQNLIRSKIGNKESDKFFQQASYVIALGSNDFINNYLSPAYRDSWTYNDESFLEYLMETLRGQITRLHRLGARNVMVFGLGPMGCIPLQRVLSINAAGSCQEKTNKLAQNFNKETSKLASELTRKLPNAQVKFGDAYDVVNSLISDPQKYGFSNADSPCCSFGRIRPALTCIPASTLCKDRSKYVFWDEYHPSDSANQLIANELINKISFTNAPSLAPSPAPALPPSTTSN